MGAGVPLFVFVFFFFLKKKQTRGQFEVGGFTEDSEWVKPLTVKENWISHKDILGLQPALEKR